MLACYFARNIIERYETLDDTIRNIFTGVTKEGTSGKCTDYTGLALHYLREYLIPLNPEKFENWEFGFESDTIDSYKHCYIKAMHINPDLTVDVYFLDPTKLSSKGLSSLKTPKDVVKTMDARTNPLQIKRLAEDLLHKEIK